MRYVVNDTPQQFYLRKLPRSRCTGDWWVPGLVWTGVENLASTMIQTPDSPVRSKSLHGLSQPKLRTANILQSHEKFLPKYDAM